MRRLAPLLTLLIALALPALAHDPAGSWTSSSGSSVQIWANMQIVQVTIQSPQGQVSKGSGAWTRFGEAFTYTIPGQGTNSCIFRGPNQIQVQSAQGVYTWTRGGVISRGGAVQTGPAPARSGGITGVWRSNSGNSFQITTSGMQIFVTVITPQGQRSAGSGRWLQYPQRFEYSIPSMGNALNTVTVNGRDSLLVQSPNGTNSWTRMR